MSQNIFKKVYDELENDDLEAAAEEIEYLFAQPALRLSDSKVRRWKKEIIQHKAAITRLERETRIGVLDPETGRRERARLLQSVVNMLEEISSGSNVIEENQHDSTHENINKEPDLQSQRNSSALNIFISYRRNDSTEATGRIYDRLVNGFGREAVYKDVDSIPYGSDFAAHIYNAIQKCKVSLIIIGPNWLKSTDNLGNLRLNDERDFVRQEVIACLHHCPKVIPTLVGNAPPPTTADLPPELSGLARLKAINIRQDPDFHNDMDRLLKAIS